MADTEVHAEAVPDDVPNGAEAEDDDEEEPDRTPDQERIAELEAFLLAEHTKVAELEAQVADLQQQLAAALAAAGSGGGAGLDEGGEAPPAPDAPPAPAAPPPPAAPAPPPPPTLKSVSLVPAGASTDGRSALLASIQKGAKLKKAVTNDRSKPATTTPKASGGGAGGGGGDSIAAMAAAKRGVLKSAPGKRTKSGRITREEAEANRSQVNYLLNLKAGPVASPAGARPVSQMSASPQPDFRGTLRKATSPAQPAASAAAAEPEPDFRTNLKKAAAPPPTVSVSEPAEAAQQDFRTGLRKATVTSSASAAKPAAAAEAKPDFRTGLKTVTGDRTKSGRMKAPQKATGPAPTINVTLRKTGQ